MKTLSGAPRSTSFPVRQPQEARKESYIKQHLVLLNGHHFSVSYLRTELISWQETSKQSVSPCCSPGCHDNSWSSEENQVWLSRGSRCMHTIISWLNAERLFICLCLFTWAHIHQRINTESNIKEEETFCNKSKLPGEAGRSHTPKFWKNNDYNNMGGFPTPFGLLQMQQRGQRMWKDNRPTSPLIII